MSVPVELGNLSNLEMLSLSFNSLTSVPIELGNLSNLVRLSLSGNSLTSVPVELGNLNNLEWLYLSNNSLTSVPIELGNLSNLVHLSFSHNSLTSVPVELGNLNNLSWLYLDNNSLMSVPVELSNLSNLSWLHLSHNSFTSIPVELGNLSNLSWLSLRYNSLTSVPVELGNLSNLEWLHLSSNSLTSVPAELGNLSNLSKLYLDNNELPCLPMEIQNLCNNIWDDTPNLSNNPGLTTWDDFCNLGIGLDCSGCAMGIIISSIPPLCNTYGTATATPVGGTPPYAYSWNTSPAQANSTVEGLVVGTYITTVTDDNGCSVTASIELQDEGVPPTGTISPNCTSTSTYEISLNLAGAGTYSINDGSNALTGYTEGAHVLTGFNNGPYNITITNELNPECTLALNGTFDCTSWVGVNNAQFPTSINSHYSLSDKQLQVNFTPQNTSNSLAVQIIHITGQLMETRRLAPHQSAIISLRDYPAGVYLLGYRLGEDYFFEKVFLW